MLLKKNDELTHHGVKGQRWGVRRYQNYDGTLKNKKSYTGGSGSGVNDPRAKYINSHGQKYTTGNSKGVKRRGNKLGTGPVGRQKNSRFTDEYNNFIPTDEAQTFSIWSSVDLNGKPTYYNFKVKTDHSLKPNQISAFQTSSGRNDIDYVLSFKDDSSYQNFANTSVGSYLLEEDTNMFAQILNQAGVLEFDPEMANSPIANVCPYMCFTNLSTEEQLMPGFLLLNSDKEKQAKLANYRKMAYESQVKHEQTLKNNKKLLTKVKRFVESYNEVTYETVAKVGDKLKKLLKFN